MIKELKIKLCPRLGGGVTNDALLVATIDSVERLAVSVADQSETGCGSARYWCQSLQLGYTAVPMWVDRGGVLGNRLREP